MDDCLYIINQFMTQYFIKLQRFFFLVNFDLIKSLILDKIAPKAYSTDNPPPSLRKTIRECVKFPFSYLPKWRFNLTYETAFFFSKYFSVSLPKLATASVETRAMSSENPLWTTMRLNFHDNADSKSLFSSQVRMVWWNERALIYFHGTRSIKTP